MLSLVFLRFFSFFLLKAVRGVFEVLKSIGCAACVIFITCAFWRSFAIFASLQVQYENQLCTMGCVCRVILPTCLPMLCQLLEERLNHWVDVFRQCYGNASLATSPEVSSSLSGLYEDLHWLVLLAGHTLCYDCLSGETPTIPKPVCDFCTSQQSQVGMLLLMLMPLPYNGVGAGNAYPVFWFHLAADRLVGLERNRVAISITWFKLFAQ